MSFDAGGYGESPVAQSLARVAEMQRWRAGGGARVAAHLKRGRGGKYAFSGCVLAGEEGSRGRSTWRGRRAGDARGGRRPEEVDDLPNSDGDGADRRGGG
jgi:hypothetical protein